MKNKILSLIWFLPVGNLRWRWLWKLGVLPPQSYLMNRVKRHYTKRMGIEPNIDKPTTFNEKLQFIKFYRQYPQMPALADKHLVRRFVTEKGYADTLVESYGVYDAFSDIDLDALPNSFVIKVTHDSGGVFVVRDKTKEDFEALKREVNKKMRYPYMHGVINGEWHYFFIKPRIVVEAYLEDDSGHLLDYKVHCFEGNPTYIHVDLDRFGNHTRKFYDIHWDPMDFTMGYPRSEKDVVKPAYLGKMLEMAKAFSQDFHYCRVDFYEAGGKLYFGEITFFHANGMQHFYPDEYNDLFGSLIHLHGDLQQSE